MEKILIAGLDSGTTKAYVVLDLSGNIITIGSNRNNAVSEVILNITKHGKIYAIGSDVYPCPNQTTKIAKKIGAKIIQPDHDLKYLEKIKIKDEFLKTKEEYIELNNKHEKDALVAALYGLKRMKSLIKKIEDRLKQENKMYIKDKIINKVLLEDKTISDALKEII